MFDSATPSQFDLAHRLPADAYYHLVRTLLLTLPPPPTDAPEDMIRRNHAAIARIAALVPANAAEADVAAQYVAASEQWKDCLRLAQLPDTKPDWAAKCRAQASSMMRQANSALRLLLRLQEARRKLEADPAACDRLAWTEHCALGLMAEALPGQPQNTAEPIDDLAPPPPSPAATEPSASPANVPPASAPAKPDPLRDAVPDSVAAAEEYAALYPERAALIRRIGRLPHDVAFGPPEDDLVQALVAARTPALAALDRAFAAAA
jgi:hypothetical protein